MRILSLIFLLLFSNFSFGQKAFSADDFLGVVLSNHPMAKRANLLPEMGERTVQKARGGFDPKGYYAINQKYFDNKQYFSLNDYGLKVPTWFGIEVKTGFENNRGDFLSQQNKTPANGLWYGGVAMNLGQGMFIDQRRAELFKARVFEQSSLAEQNLQLNELCFEAGYNYWAWFLSYHSQQVMTEALELATVRFEAIKRMADLGDRPGIDSVEARIQVQNRTAALRQFDADLTNNRALLSTFLWTETDEPLEVSEVTTPPQVDQVEMTLVELPTGAEFDSIVNNHPYLKVNDFKIETLEIERRLKREMLKPQLNLQYNLLNQPVNYNPWDGIAVTNYKWGLNFEMPLFLRKERGDLALAELKLQDAQYFRNNVKAGLQYKISSALIDAENAKMQVEIYRNTVQDTKTLFEAEKQMFDIGESTLFLLNMRETAYINSRLKLIELIVKHQQALLKLNFALATLVQR